MASLAHRNLCGKNTEFSSISEKSAASANDLKNPRYRIMLVNDLLQIGFSPALPSSSISASSFDLKNYRSRMSQLRILANFVRIVAWVQSGEKKDALCSTSITFPILPQAKILLSKVGGSSRFTGSNDGVLSGIRLDLRFNSQA
jgi:hypothetical protein